MKNLLMILPVVLLLCFAFSCQKAEEVAEEPALDIAAETKALEDAFWAQSKAGPAKDIDLFMSYMADDVLLADSSDKASIREWYTDWFAKGRYWDNTTLDKIEISASGDLAYVIATWEIFGDEGSRGRNSNVVVWKKQADGSWKNIAF
jgi:ketosteroid isomerase-like protein